ncbi:MAG: class I SAM-dependent methyltransferase [Candidatus Sericytochromatia bacterium]
MNRLTVLQAIADNIKAKYYLEIGVETGMIISNLGIRFKHGVDPAFKIPNLSVDENINYSDIKNNIINLYPVESDFFFENFASVNLYSGIDIAFIDGLHTYKQSLLDIKNSLQYLRKGGVIVIHDCNPLSFAMGYPVKKSFDEVKEIAKTGDLIGWNECWNGDVWKSILHLRLEYNNLNIFTLDLDWGLGIISKGDIDKELDINISLNDIEDLDYFFLEKNRSEILNLKPPKYLYDFLKNRIIN